MRSSTFFRALICVAAAATSTLAASQQAQVSSATGKATSVSQRQTMAPSRVMLSQPGNGHGTLQPGNGQGTLQPGNGHGTLRSGPPTPTPTPTSSAGTLK